MTGARAVALVAWLFVVGPLVVDALAVVLLVVPLLLVTMGEPELLLEPVALTEGVFAATVVLDDCCLA